MFIWPDGTTSNVPAPGAMKTSAREDIIDHVKAFVQRKYNGDWKAAFAAEDADGDGRISMVELTTILAKSGIGVVLTRWATALQIIAVLDADGDGYISWAEFSSMAGVS